MSHCLDNPNQPAWLADARCYYSQIDGASTDPVRVFAAPPGREVGSDNPGILCLHLEPRRRLVDVLDANRRERGVIRSEGIVPGTKWVMRRDGDPVWTLSVRSIVRRHHVFESSGERWTFETPFFWRRQVSGSVAGAPKLLGHVGPTMRLWFLWVEPGSDTHEVLAAVALMHRTWWRS